ncbi:MAG: alpha/beta hydrolase, partial [Bacteroidales bacterium]
VTSDTPPTFIDHANDDAVVSIQNSILFIAALQQKGVNVECFFYASGGHGYLADNLNNKAEWIDACIAWMQDEIE